MSGQLGKDIADLADVLSKHESVKKTVTVVGPPTLAKLARIVPGSPPILGPIITQGAKIWAKAHESSFVTVIVTIGLILLCFPLSLLGMILGPIALVYTLFFDSPDEPTPPQDEA